MTIEAKIIEDSITESGERLTTFQLSYWRAIHSEFMTHRTFSRNASSSRAIPVKKMLDDISNDPAMPIYWGANQSGMQAAEELSDEKIELCKEIWLETLNLVKIQVQRLNDLGLHKQTANRLLEPWQHIRVVMTCSEAGLANFFALRAHPDAQPEIQELAIQMMSEYLGSKPKVLKPGEWHLPYVDTTDVNWKTADISELIKCSAARCARVSYLNHDQSSPEIQKDLDLFARLIKRAPVHASPVEHQATPAVKSEIGTFNGNFSKGWVQNRKLIPNEFVDKFYGSNHPTNLV